MILRCACCTKAQETLAHIVSIHCHFSSGQWVSRVRIYTCDTTLSVFRSMYKCKTHHHIRQGIEGWLWLMCDRWAVLVLKGFIFSDAVPVCVGLCGS